MKRLVLITGLMIVLLLVLHVPVTYAKERTGHDSDMEQVFFGDVKAGSGQKKVAKTLEAAAYLTIDQFGGNGQNSLDILNKNICEVDYPEIKDIDISSSELSHHREYTHQGWRSKYRHIEGHGEDEDKAERTGEDGDKWPEKWKLRKKILEDTVDAIFGFSWWNRIPFLGNVLPDHGQQADSLCALIYYTHLLGDHIETKKMDQYGYLMPVGGKINQHDIIDELIYYCDTLLVNSAEDNERVYGLFEDELRKIDTKYFQLGGMTEEKLEKNREYAKEVLEVLGEYVPGFLENEDFYDKMEEFDIAA